MALIVLTSTESTMDVAREMLSIGQVAFAADGTAEPGGVLALDQTAGRGQRGRNWYSVPGQSLCATYFLPLSQEAFSHAGKVAILAGASVANALDGLFPNDAAIESPNSARHITDGDSERPSSLFGLKWPNDLLLAGKKLGGILVEVTSNSEMGMIALIGVGINVGVRQFPPEIKSFCTSLALNGLFPDSLLALANQVRKSLDLSAAVQHQHGFAATLESWKRYDQTVGRRFRTETAAGVKTGAAMGVDAEGALVLRTEEGAIITVISASATSEL